MKKRTYIKIISFLSAVCILLASTSIVYSVRANRYKILLSAERERSLAELAEAIDAIGVSLQKSLYCSSGKMLTENGNELYRLSTLAKDNLSSLTDENEYTETIFKFLSQVGDYTLYLSEKENLTEKEQTQLYDLYNYAKSLSKEIGFLADSYYDGEISFQKASGNLMNEEKKIDFLTSFSDTEQTIGDYPTLLYDGPFSDTLLNREALAVKGKSEITKEEGRNIAAKILSAKPTDLREESDQSSSLPLFCYSKGEKFIGITKQGGFLCYMTNPDFTKEATISPKEAIKRGSSFLKKQGFEGMADSYYSVFDDVCTVNYAYRENGITYYADLIKVSVALDTGKVVAFDASGYLMNHCERKLPTELLTEKECRKAVSTNLQIIDFSSAVIPLESGKEKLCLEYHCLDKKHNQEVLVYIDRETGMEEDIMLLLYSDGGVLTK